MLNRTHGACGAASGALLGAAAQAVAGPMPALAVSGVALGFVGALAPDFDHLDASPVRAWTWTRVTFRGSRLLRIPRFTWRIGIGPLISWLLRAVSQLLTGRKHRGLTHSLFFAVLLGGLTALAAGHWLGLAAATYLGVATAAGVVSALLGDLVTPGGLKHLLWPTSVQVEIPKRWRISVGGLVERFVVFPVAFAATGVGLALIVGGGALGG